MITIKVMSDVAESQYAAVDWDCMRDILAYWNSHRGDLLFRFLPVKSLDLTEYTFHHSLPVYRSNLEWSMPSHLHV
jgi:hypothetical protein